MKNRLEVAKELLSDDGVIFVSLDDNEAHYCKVLMDEVFKRENFVADIAHKSRASVSNDKIISPNHNHILFFAKNQENIYKKRETFGVSKDLSTFNLKNKNGYYKLSPVDGPGGEKKGNPYYEFLGVKNYWRFSKETMEEMYNNNLVVKKGKSLYQKYYRSKAEKSTQTITTWWEGGLLTSSASGQLGKLLDNSFSNPKNESLIELIIEIATQPNDIVLDFFTGSGTTGAVAHKMGRQWIAIEQMDYIEDITKTRIAKVVDGEQGGISKALNWQGGGDFVYMELSTYNQQFINQIEQAETNRQLLKIYTQMKEKAFLEYNVDLKEIDNNVDLKEIDNNVDLKEIDISELKDMLLNFLNLNMLYQPISMLEDERFNLSSIEKDLNNKFHAKTIELRKLDQNS